MSFFQPCIFILNTSTEFLNSAANAHRNRQQRHATQVASGVLVSPEKQKRVLGGRLSGVSYCLLSSARIALFFL